MQYQAILFDLDGTLVDTIGFWMKAYRQTLHAYNIEMTEEEFLQRIYSVNAHYHQILSDHGIPEDIHAQFKQNRDDAYCAILAKEVEWIDGAREVVETIGRQYPIGMVTGSWQRYVDSIDSRLQLSPLFNAIVTCDENQGRQKPHPDPLLLCAKKLDVDPSQCLYVGDQQFDLDAAEAAGMDFVLVPCEYTPEATIEETLNVVTLIKDLKI